jgi:UDP-N-acetyl-D-glucosamine/UDP-N-acetyl-D-galactosamine dehydrogenase
MNLKNRTIAVIGLGYVGLPLAVEFGKKRPVIGFDIKADRIAELQAGHDHTFEVSEEELKEAKSLTFTSDSSSLRGAEEAAAISVEEPMIFIITVPTPVDKANRPDLTPLIKASETVGRVLKSGDVVIYESTVYPGATEEVCVPILERESGLRYITEPPSRGADGAAAIQRAQIATTAARSRNDESGFFCAYSPERINPGDKTHRLPHIKKVTSGSTPEIALAVDELYKEIITAGTHLASSIRVAEAAKVIENAQRDLNIAFVNELSVIFARMGIDTTEVLAAAATKWNFLPFKPGLVGGHCIGVDPYYLTHKAQELGYRPQVILSGRAINDNMGRYAARNVVRLMLKNGINVANATVGVLGITFKENCPDVRNSKVIDIIRELQHWGLKVKVADPWANEEEVREEYGVELTTITPDTPVDSIIIAVAHQEFASLMPVQLKALCATQSKPVIADLKALRDRDALQALGFEVFRF